MPETGRPDRNPEWSLLEKILQPLCAVLVLANFAVLAAVWGSLPVRIPTHFGASGAADAWGGKGSLLLMPILMAVMAAGLTLLERFPKIFNFPVEINEKNAAVLYRLGRELIVVLKTVVVLIFSYIQFQTVEVARNARIGLGGWFLPVTLLVMFGSIGFYIYLMVRHKDG